MREKNSNLEKKCLIESGYGNAKSKAGSLMTILISVFSEFDDNNNKCDT
jgi:hypothetical protein